MLKQNYEYRTSARQQLTGKWMMSVLVILISYILTQVFEARSGVKYSYVNGELVKQVSSAYVNFGALINFILAGPVTFGVATYFLKVARGQNPIIEDILSGFKNFGNTFILNLVSGILIVLWTLLFIIPGIVAALRYSMAYYIMNDNPEISSMDAIRQSKEMMRGNKGKLFMLVLSFAGWFLLGILTFGIGLLWVGTYYNAAKANFYEDLKQSYNMSNYAEN